jgi:hypothetical protein
MASISNRVNWILDLGVIKHFIGIQSDLTNFKRWNVPKIVRIANGSLVKCTGWGRASVLDFRTMRLLLVKAFTQNGYNVVFLKDSASCTRNNRLYFKALLINDVYIVEEEA